MFGWIGRLLGRRQTGVPRPTGADGGDDRLGPVSEKQARAFLERAGFRILAANYRCPLGELDLIAEGEGFVVFVEVKARRLRTDGTGVRPERAVNRRKQRRIGKAARYFCRNCNRRDARVRFDVIALDWPVTGEPVIRHHRGAFRPE